jgi:hypothetical protein
MEVVDKFSVLTDAGTAVGSLRGRASDVTIFNTVISSRTAGQKPLSPFW